MKYLLEKILQTLAKLVLKKYKPKIIAITGSVGKTSAKEAIFSVLKNYFDVEKSPANYNNELGVPLAILNCPAPRRSLIKWLGAFFRALKLIICPCRYPKVLILEMGADHPGDIKKLIELAPPAISLVTAVAPVHLEFFGTLKKVAAEKGKITESLKNNSTAILNADDDLVLEMADKTKAKVLTFGFNQGAAIKAIEMNEKLGEFYFIGEPIGGVYFKLVYEGSIVPIFVPEVLGRQQVYAALAAAAAGLAMGLNLVQISEGLRQYRAPAGRMRLLAGIKKTLLIDDTYNSSPKAVGEALEALKRLPLSEEISRFAVMGDMLELGEFTQEAHQELGKQTAQSAEWLIAVGEKMKLAADAAVKAGMPQEHVICFSKAEEAGHFLQNEIKQGDVILIKGSQGMRMERVTKELIAEPLKAGELLVRQGKEWQQ